MRCRKLVPWRSWRAILANVVRSFGLVLGRASPARSMRTTTCRSLRCVFGPHYRFALVARWRSPRAAAQPRGARGSVPAVHARQRPERHPARDTSVPIVAVNVWYHVGSANEQPGPHRLRAPVRAPDVRGLEERARRASSTRCSRRAGGNNNGSTTNDRTNYFIDVPSNALELALFLESDRMGYLLDTMTPERVDGQRDVVKNERRQSYENRPYGMASTRARRDAVSGGPSRTLADDRLHGGPDRRELRGRRRSSSRRTTRRPTPAWSSPATSISTRTQALVEKWFGEVPRGADGRRRSRRRPRVLTGVKRKTMTDRVQLPRLYLAWLTPRRFAPGDAALDVRRRRARRRQELAALQAARLRHADRAGRRGVPGVRRARQLVPDRRDGAAGPHGRGAAEGRSTRRSRGCSASRRPRAKSQRALNQIEASFYRRMERVGGFGGKADQLNAYFAAGGDPDCFDEDLARYTALSPADVQAAVARVAAGRPARRARRRAGGEDR